MADNERELGVRITARNNTSSAVTNAITDVERLNLAVRMAGGSFQGLTSEQLRAIEATAGLKKGTLDATAALERQTAVQGTLATNTGLTTQAIVAQTTATRNSITALNEETTATERAVAARDALVAAHARSAVRTPVVFMPQPMAEGMAIPNEASIRLLAVRQAEAEAEALAIARASALNRMPAPDFWAQHETRMGYRNAPMDAEGSADVFKERFAQQDYAGRRFEGRQEAQGNLATAGLASGARTSSEAAVYATIAAFKEEAAALATVEAQTNLTAAALANFQRVNSEAGFAAAIAGLKEEAAALANVEAQAKMAAAEMAGMQRFQAESSAYAVIATTQQWEQALRTTGNAASEARNKIEQLYNTGSVERRSLSEGIDRNIESKHAFGSLDEQEQGRRNAAMAFGGRVVPDEEPEPEVRGGRSGGGGRGRNNIATNEVRHITALADEGFRGQRGQMMATLGSALRDAGLSAGALATSFGAFVTVLAGAALLKGAEDMGKWAESVRALSSATGMSIKSVTEIQAVLEMTGGKASDADVALKRFAISVSTALGDSSSKAAKDFAALNISLSELGAHSKDADGGFRFFVQKLNEAKDSGNKATAANGILGRSFQKIAPAITEGLSAYDQHIAKADELGLTLDEKTSAALVATGDKIRGLGLIIKGEGIQSFIAWQTEINGFIETLAGLAQAIGKVSAAIGQIPKLAKEGIDKGLGAKSFAEAGRSGFFGQNALDPNAPKPPEGPTIGEWIKGKLGFTTATDVGAAASAKDAAEAKAKQTFDVKPPNAGTTEKGDIDKELALARMNAAKTTKDAAQQHINEIKAEIKVFEEHVKAMKVTPVASMPGAGAAGSEAQEEATAGHAKLLEQMETRLANKQAELYEAQARGSTRGQPTASNELANRIAQAKEAVEMLSGTTKDAAIAGAEAAIKELERTLSVEKMTAKDRMVAETELANAKIALHNKILADTQSKQIEEIKTTLTVTTQQQKQDQVEAKFGALTSNKPENDLKAAQTESLQVLAAGEAAIQKLQDMAAAGNMTAESIAKINEAMATIRTDTMQRMIDLFNSAGKAAKTSSDIFANAWGDALGKLDGQVEGFASEITKTMLAPQQELIKAGLTTIHVSLEGQQLRAAAQKIFLSIASDFVSSITSGLSQVAAKKLFGDAITPGSGIGSGLAQWLGGGKNNAGQAAGFGITSGANKALGGGVKGDPATMLTKGLGGATASLHAFDMALKTTTKTVGKQTGAAQEVSQATKTEAVAAQTGATSLELHAGTTQTAAAAQAANAGATTLNTGAKAGDTGALAVHATSVEADSGGFITHALKMAADTAAEIWHTIVTLLSLEGGGVVPSAAGGMVVGGGLGGARGGILSILHPHEMVLPRHLSEGVQGMISRGGSQGRDSSSGNGSVSSIQSSTMNYAPRINVGRGGMSRAEMSQMMVSQASSFAGVARNLMRKGWRP